MKEKYYISLLKKIARDIELVGNHRLAACIVKRNKIISFGHNKNKTHPLQSRFARNECCVFLHAEIDAIRNALKEVHTDDLIGTTLYIARIKKDGSEGLAKPCGNHRKGCMHALETFGISKIIYTTNVENEYEMINNG